MKTCEVCGLENDDTRVFCHNCAARLPAPAPGSLPGLPKKPADVVGAAAPPVSSFKPATRPKPPGKIRQARRGFFETLFGLLPWLFIAGLGVAIYLILQPPDNIPAPAVPNAEESDRMAVFFQDASRTPGGAWQGEQNAINRFLAANVRLEPVANSLGVKSSFERCYAKLLDGRMDFTLQIAIFDRDLYLTLALAPATENGRLQPRVLGAELGRLPVPSPLASLLLPVWSPCVDSLAAVVDLLQKAESAEVKPGRLVIRWPSGSQASR
jgi:hypothetical protein